jgi:rhodanese-related sulfurtransferase
MIISTACGQVPENRPFIQNPKFDKKISSLISFSIPTISVKELEEKQKEVLLLDAREKEEYEISHIEGAKYLGYDQPDFDVLADVPEDTEIVLYCSIGYRSEKIGEKLKKKGYTNVKNLYGSIFEWANQGLPLVDSKGDNTDKVHTYNKQWSRWLDNQQFEKVW